MGQLIINLKKMKKFIYKFLIILIFILPQTGFFKSIKATSGKFEVNINRQYFVEEDLTIHTVEIEQETNKTNDLYIPKGTEKRFDILAIETNNSDNRKLLKKSAESAKVYRNGKLDNNTKIELTDTKASVISSYPNDLNPNETVTFKFEYTNYLMLEQNGGLKDIFLNGFASSTNFITQNRIVKYETKIYVHKNLGIENFIFPENVQKTSNSEYYIYEIDQNDLVGNYVWLQFGNMQYYKFKIIQDIQKSETTNSGNKNRYEIIIPRDITSWKVNQTVFFTKIFPTPKWVRTDEEGNLFATFEFDSNKDGQIIIQGFAEVKINDIPETTDFGKLEDIDLNTMQKYLLPADFWEVDNPLIQNQAKELKADKNDIYEITKTTYDFVISQIDYSEIKRFGLNERQGAVKTLQGGAAVCMEYSDLFLTLMRAQGVPARAVFGYGYDPKVDSSSQEAHQWVQIYAPKLNNWINIDVTWGETGPSLIGGDLNHFFTHIAAISPNTPPGISTAGFGDLNLKEAKYEIEIIENIPNTYTKETTKDLLNKYPYKEQKDTEEMLKLLGSKTKAAFENIRNPEQLDRLQMLLIIIIMVSSIFLLLATIKVIRKLFSKLNL